MTCWKCKGTNVRLTGRYCRRMSGGLLGGPTGEFLQAEVLCMDWSCSAMEFTHTASVIKLFKDRMRDNQDQCVEVESVKPRAGK